MTESELYHHGIKGQKWGVRRFQNEDGTLTSAGKKHVAEGKSVNFNSKGGTDLSQLGGSSGGGGGGGAPLDEEDQKKLDEDMERMKELLEQRIADGDLEDHPLVEDDDDVRVIIYENGSDPDKMSKQQFDTYKRQLQEFEKYSRNRLAEARVDKGHQGEHARNVRARNAEILKYQTRRKLEGINAARRTKELNENGTEKTRLAKNDAAVAQGKKTHRSISPEGYAKKAQSDTPSIASNLHKAQNKLKDAAHKVRFADTSAAHRENLRGQKRTEYQRDQNARQRQSMSNRGYDASSTILSKNMEYNRAKREAAEFAEQELKRRNIKHSYQAPSESELYHRYPFIQR